MDIGGIKPENPIPDTIKRAYCLLVRVLPLPREASFAGQNREEQGADWAKGLGPAPKRTIPHDWVEEMVPY